MEVIACQVLNVDSNINEPEQVQDAGRSCLREMACAVESRQKDLWQPPLRPSAVQKFPHQIVFNLSQRFDNNDSFFHKKHLLCTLLSEGWIFQLNLFRVTALISCKCDVYDVHIKRTTIACSRAGMGCLATKAFLKAEVVGFTLAL